MKKFLLLGLLVILTACSEEVAQEKDEEIITNNETLLTEQKNLSSIVEDQVEKETKEEIAQTEESTEDEKNVIDEENGKNTNEHSTTKSTTVAKETQEVIDIKEEGLYNYYSNFKIEPDQAIKFTTLDESTIELPLYSENENVFELEDTLVTLESFKNGEIEYFEEPISNGYLVVLNLNQLNEENYGNSYSLMYNDIEYAFFITEDDPNVALAVIDNVNLDSVKKAKLLIMK